MRWREGQCERARVVLSNSTTYKTRPRATSRLPPKRQQVGALQMSAATIELRMVVVLMALAFVFPALFLRLGLRRRLHIPMRRFLYVRDDIRPVDIRAVDDRAVDVGFVDVNVRALDVASLITPVIVAIIISIMAVIAVAVGSDHDDGAVAMVTVVAMTVVVVVAFDYGGLTASEQETSANKGKNEDWFHGNGVWMG